MLDRVAVAHLKLSESSWRQYTGFLRDSRGQAASASHQVRDKPSRLYPHCIAAILKDLLSGFALFVKWYSSCTARGTKCNRTGRSVCTVGVLCCMFVYGFTAWPNMPEPGHADRAPAYLSQRQSVLYYRVPIRHWITHKETRLTNILCAHDNVSQLLITVWKLTLGNEN
jgi:hypothetical protein